MKLFSFKIVGNCFSSHYKAQCLVLLFYTATVNEGLPDLWNGQSLELLLICFSRTNWTHSPANGFPLRLAGPDRVTLVSWWVIVHVRQRKGLQSRQASYDSTTFSRRLHLWGQAEINVPLRCRTTWLAFSNCELNAPTLMGWIGILILRQSQISHHEWRVAGWKRILLPQNQI